MKASIRRAFLRGYLPIRFVANPNETPAKAARPSGAAAPTPGDKEGTDPAAEVAKKGGRNIRDLLKARRAREEQRGASSQKAAKQGRGALRTARAKDRKRKAEKSSGKAPPSSGSTSAPSQPSSKAPASGGKSTPGRSSAPGPSKQGKPTKAGRTESPKTPKSSTKVPTAKQGKARERIRKPGAPTVRSPSERPTVKPGTKQTPEAEQRSRVARSLKKGGIREVARKTPSISSKSPRGGGEKKPKPCTKVAKTGRCLKRMSSEQATLDAITPSRRSANLRPGRSAEPSDGRVIRTEAVRAKLAAYLSGGKMSGEKARDFLRAAARVRGDA